MTSNNTGYSSQTTGYTNSSGSYGSSNSVSQSTPSANSYPSNSYSNNQTSYAYQTYPANNYHSSGQTYPPQSYQSAGATYPYQSAAAQQNHKMNASIGSSQGKDSQVCQAHLIRAENLWCSLFQLCVYPVSLYPKSFLSYKLNNLTKVFCSNALKKLIKIVLFSVFSAPFHSTFSMCLLLVCEYLKFQTVSNRLVEYSVQGRISYSSFSNIWDFQIICRLE